MALIEKVKIDLKHMPEKIDAITMLLTLAKQYGLWTDMDYEPIQNELNEVYMNGDYGDLLNKFDEYFGKYVYFGSDPRK
jgi:hypothetical protein|tara:strand:+ start:220 stop:456 length:237 start_codon:yes stop_codon:yes gene_type:complete